MPRVEVSVVKAKASHVRHVARNMRQADRDEVFAASRRTPAGALIYSLRKSEKAYTALVDGVPVAIFGVATVNVLANLGAPWLLGTDEIERNYVAFLRGSIDWRTQLFGGYSSLTNFVDVRNEVSIRWLKWLGFSFSDPIRIKGHDFLVFELRAENVRRNSSADGGRDDPRGNRYGAGRPGDGAGV